MPALTRQRDVSESGEGIEGHFYSAKLSRHVQFESNIELSFYLKLEHAADVIVYQEQPFVLHYEYEGRRRNYFPDVFFVLADGRGVVAEIKPKMYFALHNNLVKWSAMRRFCEREGYGLLVTDGRICIQTLVRHPVPVAFATALRARVETGPLMWPEYRRIRDDHGASLIDFVAAVLQYRLIWHLQPFEVCAAEPSHRVINDSRQVTVK